MDMKLGDLARRIGADLEGDGDVSISGVAGLREATPGQLSFLANPRYLAAVQTTRASAVIVPRSFSTPVGIPVLRVADAYAAFLGALKLFHPIAPPPCTGVDPRASIDGSATVGRDVSVGPFAVVEAGARIGDGSSIGAGSFVGRDVVLGEACVLHPNVVLLRGVRLGSRVVIHAGTVIGSDGFGYVPGPGGHEKIPQVGTVIVEDDVEIGANVAVDRATLGETRIGRGVKIDNLVHIAHNVTVGERTLIVAQVGVSGSTRVGRGVILGGQSGLVGHIEIGDGARVGAQAGVTKTVPAETTVSGYPAMEHERAKKLNAHLRRLPGLVEELRALEERIRDLEKIREKTR